jgi:diphosphomevalonate decarboxylase
MKEFDSFLHITPKKFESRWISPANIAFVKYWGKKGHQLPANPSVSMTLKNCITKTRTEFDLANNLSVEVYLDGQKEDKFAEKIKKYLEELPFSWLKNVSLKIHTENSFPHGTGIASSASGLSAFALTLTEYLYHSIDRRPDDQFFNRASHLGRLASGSACRSLFGGFATWGDVSDEFASPLEVHSEMKKLKDTVLVISGKEKSVSSRHGHSRMQEHPFKDARFAQAKVNYQTMKSALMAGDIEVIGKILENEALTLHALMMTSTDSYTLLKPNTLAGIEKITQFRHETKLPLFFTLDAGPNLHLIHPESTKITQFINSELKPLCEKVILDEVGLGPIQW